MVLITNEISRISNSKFYFIQNPNFMQKVTGYPHIVSIGFLNIYFLF
jgi:hypothetical protein